MVNKHSNHPLSGAMPVLDIPKKAYRTYCSTARRSTKRFLFRLEQHESRIFYPRKNAGNPKKTSSIRYTWHKKKASMCIIYRQNIYIIDDKSISYMYIYRYMYIICTYCIICILVRIVGHGWLTGFPVSVESTQVPAHHPSRRQKVQDLSKSVIKLLQPGKLTWNLKITYLKRKNHLPNLHFWVPC